LWGFGSEKLIPASLPHAGAACRAIFFGTKQAGDCWSPSSFSFAATVDRLPMSIRYLVQRCVVVALPAVAVALQLF